jgi:hypothetical protein
MPDFTDYPDDLQPHLSTFSEAVDALMRDLEEGRITVSEWRERFAELLASFALIGYLVGTRNNPIRTPRRGRGKLPPTPPGAGDDLTGDALTWMENWLAAQLDYLNGFEDAIKINTSAGGGYSPGWNGRARMYTGAMIAPYWYGATDGLPLPAYPGDLSSACGALDACGWVIEWVNKDKGDADAYWKLNQRRHVQPQNHCQQCVERSHQWNPLRIRGWRLQIPRTAQSGGVLV